MTEKRFTMSILKCKDTGVRDNNDVMNTDEVCELLNELYEDLKHELTAGKALRDIVKELENENEQLKSEYKVLHTQYQDLKKFVENNFDEYLTQEKLNRQIIKLSEENEQLKQQLKECTAKAKEEIRKQEEENAIRWANIGG